MTKRTLSILIAASLAFGVLVPLRAQAQTAIPAAVNIDDPFGDLTPVDYSSVGDLGKIWFSHTAEEISVHVQTEAPPPATQGVAYSVYASPNDDFPSPEGCLRFIAIVSGNAPTWEGGDLIKLIDRCNDPDGTNLFSNGVEGTLLIEELADGTGLVSMTFPRSYSPLLVDGGVLTEPYGRSDIALGSKTVGSSLRQPMDTTEIGTPYTIGGTAKPEPEPKEEPPGKSDPPGKGKKKGCKKGKGKKKGACPGVPKPPPAPSCPAYVPGEEGAEAETTVVTDAATEEKPVVVELTAAAGGPALGPVDETSHVYQNVQLDSAAAEAGLWVRIEFTNGHDYDLNLNHPDGSRAANSGESQPVAGAGGGSEGGYEGGSNYEMITGMRTADCAGFTTDIVSYLTTGGPVTLSYWLGEAKFDGAAPGDAALDTFFGFLGVTR